MFRRNSVFHYAVAALCVLGALACIHTLGMHDAVAGVSTAVIVLSDQLTRTSDDQVRNYPIDRGGKLREVYFKYTNNTGGTLADGTQVDLTDLPQGRFRILPNLSRYRSTALGASRTLSIGLRAYYKDTISNTPVAEDGTCLVNAKDVSGAVNDTAFDGGANNMSYTQYGTTGIRVFATLAGGTIPAAAVIEGYIVYVAE